MSLVAHRGLGADTETTLIRKVTTRVDVGVSVWGVRRKEYVGLVVGLWSLRLGLWSDCDSLRLYSVFWVKGEGRGSSENDPWVLFGSYPARHGLLSVLRRKTVLLKDPEL